MTFQSARIDGRLTRALAISFALHILLLWPAPAPLTMAGHAASLLSATLRAFDRPVEPPPAVPPRKLHPSPLPASASAPPSVLSRTEAAPSEPVAPVPSAAGASPASAPDRAAPAQAAAVPRPSPASEGLDADGLRQFRLALAREARRFKRYPARALEAGWSGTAEVRLTFVADAAGSRAEVVRGSGYGVLDEAALEMLRQATPATPLPESLRGRAFAINLPVVFDLPE